MAAAMLILALVAMAVSFLYGNVAGKQDAVAKIERMLPSSEHVQIHSMDKV